MFDRAGELNLRRSMEASRQILPPDEELVVYKDNSDGKGNSYGCHENYLMDRATPFGQIVTHATAHFITRQLYTGSGKIGSEVPGLTAGPRSRTRSPSAPTSSRKRSVSRPR